VKINVLYEMMMLKKLKMMSGKIIRVYFFSDLFRFMAKAFFKDYFVNHLLRDDLIPQKTTLK